MGKPFVPYQKLFLCFAATFWANPQYRISITEGDEDDEEGAQAVVIGVMQKERRKMRREGEMDLTIGYAVYEVGVRCV